MKYLYLSALIGLLTYHAQARDLIINDQQQGAILVICEKAARSPSVTLDEIYNISQFCIVWRDLIARNANVPAPAPEEK